MTQQDIQTMQEHLLKVAHQAVDRASAIFTLPQEACSPEALEAGAALLEAAASAFSSVAIGPVDPPDAA